MSLALAGRITFHPVLKSLEIPLIHPDTEIKEATRGLAEAKSLLLAITESFILSFLHLSAKNRPIKVMYYIKNHMHMDFLISHPTHISSKDQIIFLLHLFL